MTSNNKPVLWNSAFTLAFAANFMMMFAFYLLMPTLPFYLQEFFHAGKSTVGFVMSVYILAALAIRPFSAYFIDTMDRKKLYIAAYIIFTLMFVSYVVAAAIALFVIFRIIHGFAFGITTMTGNTIAIDVLPSERRGEGIGYFGLSSNVAMALGPTAGLLLMNHLDFNYIFWFAFLFGIAGLLLAFLIKTEHKPTAPTKEPLSLDRFILVKAIPLGLNLLMISLSYGLILSFGAVFGHEIKVASTGMFYTIMAIGIFISRFASGRFLNKGLFRPIGIISIVIIATSYFILFQTTSDIEYFSTAFSLGIGFGMLTPAFQTMVINMAPHNRRGTANSTYFTSFDLGVGGGMYLGGKISEIWSLNTAFLIVAIINVIALIVFITSTMPHYRKSVAVNN